MSNYSVINTCFFVRFLYVNRRFYILYLKQMKLSVFFLPLSHSRLRKNVSPLLATKPPRYLCDESKAKVVHRLSSPFLFSSTSEGRTDTVDCALLNVTQHLCTGRREGDFLTCLRLFKTFRVSLL